jgi:hypothetical protein
LAAVSEESAEESSEEVAGVGVERVAAGLEFIMAGGALILVVLTMVLVTMLTTVARDLLSTLFVVGTLFATVGFVLIAEVAVREGMTWLSTVDLDG